MSDFFVPFLILVSLIGLGWVLRRRHAPVLHRAILDALEDAVLVYDQDDQIVFLNRAAHEWFGLDEAENYEPQSLHSRLSPVDEFITLLSREGRASLRVGSRYVEAVSQRVESRGADQVTIVLRDVTASHGLMAEEHRRLGELAVFNGINQAVGSSVGLDELLNSVLIKLKLLFSYSSAAISLWDPKREQLVTRARVGLEAKLGGALPLNQGFASRIVREREPLLLDDTSQYSEPGGDRSMRSYVGAPLLMGANLVGTLELTSDQVAAFSRQALDTLQVIANHTAVAIENARLYRETLLRAEEKATMNTLSAAINASLDLDELLEIIVYSVSQAIECDRSAIFLMDNERGVLSLAKSRGLSDDFVRQNQHIVPRLGGRAQVVLDRYPLVVGDVQHAAISAQFASMLDQEGVASFVDLPLRGREHVLGALTVYYDQPLAFDEPELGLLQAIANQVTLALENARLYQQTDRALARRVDQLAAIEEIGRELTSTLDTTRVFNMVLQRAMGSTGASAGLLALCDATGDELELIVDHGYPLGVLERYRSEGWPITHGIVGRVARTGETALVNDVRADANYVPHLSDTCAQLIVPIVKEARVLGVVSLESSRSQGFSPDDVRFTTQLAEMAAIAIDNARLFQQVSEGRDNLQAILDSTHEGILVIDREKRIVLANPMIEEMSGLSAQTLVGRRVKEVVGELGSRMLSLLGYPAGDLEQAASLLEASSDQVTKRTYEVLDSPSRHIEQVALPVIDRDGTVVGRLVVFRDVTEEHRLVQMRQNLTDMIVHDLRSPLTAVIGGVQVASDLLRISADPEAIQRALAMADQSCNRLMSLVDSLLDISRLDAGQMPLELQPVSLPALAQSVVQQMEPLAQRETVTLQLQTVSAVPSVDADYELINRVLINLVDNALKHSPRNGAVTIEITPDAGKRERELAEHGLIPEGLAVPAVRCAVIDTGPGIPVEYRNRVFERFAQLDSRRKGKGLGLAFCQLVVQAHGGHIWVEDNPAGPGSAFSFTLPVVSLDLSSPADPDSTENPPRDTYESSPP
jgi:NtrC-family two-component system sensor histidine kinase KinB